MTSNVNQSEYYPTFVAVTVAPAVVRAVDQLVRARRQITEAHLVAMRASSSAPDTTALVIVSEDASVVTMLERELRSVLSSQARPTVVHFAPGHTQLPWVRALGGELKRDTGRFPWWIFFLGG